MIKQQMTKHYLHHPIYLLLFVLVFITPSNGQSQIKSQTGSLSDQKTMPIGQPKIINLME